MTSNNFKNYNNMKENLIEILKDSKEFYDKIGEEKISSSLQDNIEVIKSGEFEVVVVGEFSAGKSTFLNALMGEKYLPSYTKETTATINYLRHSSESDKKGIVYYMDGNIEELESLDSATIEKYVSTKNKEMDVSKSIKHLDLFLESPFLENHVTLIDSPGLNGMKQGLGDITDAQIKKSHAVIFMFSAEQPGKRSDFEFLKKIKDEVNTVFLVLNKIDSIKKSENQTIADTIDTLISNYKNEFPDDNTLPEVIPIAAYPALVARSKMNLDYPSNHFDLSEEEKIELEKKSLMGAFEDKLTHFLSNSEKSIMQIREPVMRLKSYLSDSVKKIDNEIAVLNDERSGTELENQIIEIQKTIQLLEQQINEQRTDIRKSIKTLERNILEYMNREIESSGRKINSSIEELDSIDALDDHLEFINKTIKKEVKQILDRVDERFRDEFFDQVQEQYVNIINMLEEKMDDISVSGINFDLKINVSAKNINAGIENFNSMKKDIESQIAEIENNIRNANLKEDELIEMQSKADYLKDKSDRIRRSQQELQSTFCPPEVEITVKTGIREVPRSGLRKILDLFSKKTEEYSYEEKDDSARKAYIENFKIEQQELKNKQDVIEEKLESFYGSDKKLEKVSQEKSQLQEMLLKLRNKETETVRRFNDELNKKYEQEIIRIKKKMKSQAEDCFDEVVPMLKKELKDNRDKYTELLQELLDQSINSQLDLKKKEYENLQKLKADADDSKEEMLKEKNADKNKVFELLKQADEFINKIDNIKIDKIKYTEI